MTDRDLITEGRAALKSHATSGVVNLGQWARANLGAVLDELEALCASLAAIKAADPDLFDPRGGTSRGAAYETYGSAGHDLREKLLAAVGLVPEDEEDDDDE